MLINSINERLRIEKGDSLNLEKFYENRQNLTDDDEVDEFTAAQVINLIKSSGFDKALNGTNENIQPFEIDTFALAKRLKDTLAMNGISQRVSIFYY